MTCHSGKTKHLRHDQLLDDPESYGPRAYRCTSDQHGKWTAVPCSHLQAERRSRVLAAVTENLTNASEGGYLECLGTDRSEEVAIEMLDYTTIAEDFSGLQLDELAPIVREAQESMNASRSTTGA